MTMTERAMIAAIHSPWKKRQSKPHHQSMTGASMTYAGTPDQYYEGMYGNAFCEYKFCKFRKLPKSIDVGKLLTTKQKKWLARAHINGVKCVVGVGFKHSNNKIYLVYLEHPGAWEGKIDTADESWLTTTEAGDYIIATVGVSR